MKKFLFLAGIIIAAVALHIMTQYRVFALFLAPASIPLLLVLIDPIPLIASIGALLILDAYSTLPQGTMLLMFLVPLGVRWLWGNISADLTWNFFFFVLTTIILQIALLAGISIGEGPWSFAAIPWGILALQAGITSAGTFVLAFIYSEYSS